MASNGQLDPATLADVTGRGDYLTHGAARDFIALRDAIKARYGITLGVTELYRDRAAQDYVWELFNAGDPRVPFPPAPKYTSNHGWAEAADVSGYSTIPDFDSILAAFGWVRDVTGEPWHLHHIRSVIPAGDNTSLFPVEVITKELTMLIYKISAGALSGLYYRLMPRGIALYRTWQEAEADIKRIGQDKTAGGAVLLEESSLEQQCDLYGVKRSRIRELVVARGNPTAIFEV